MRFIFWQNIISIHQSAFLTLLAKENDVILVVEQEIENRRIKDGWTIPELENVKIYVKPENNIIDDLLKLEQTIHLFSGLGGYKFIHFVFKQAIAKKIRIALISEPFDWLGLKGKLRYLKYLTLRIKYESKIDFVLTIGNKGRECFQKIGFPKEKLYDWAYFTENLLSLEHTNKNNETKPNIVFIGSINKEKGILDLINACKTLEDFFNCLTIIGQGNKIEKLKLAMNQSKKYNYLGVLSNSEVKKIISQSDLVILPSIGKDGWGAVVNESLTLGVPVITSDFCGASVLLDGKLRGEVFIVKNNELAVVLKKWLLKGPLKESDSMKIKSWAKINISAKTACDYFLSIINKVYFNNYTSVIAPWLK